MAYGPPRGLGTTNSNGARGGFLRMQLPSGRRLIGVHAISDQRFARVIHHLPISPGCENKRHRGQDLATYPFSGDVAVSPAPSWQS